MRQAVKPETWVQVYEPQYDPGPDGAPRKEFWRSEFMGTGWSVSSGLHWYPRTTQTAKGFVQAWRRVR